MFDHKHYVAIVRWKLAERKALMHLSDETRTRMTPLLEIPVRGRLTKANSESSELYLSKVAQEIRTHWCYNPVLVDLRHVVEKVPYDDGKHPVVMLEDFGREWPNNLSIVPVTGINRPVSYQRAVKLALRSGKSGACIRLNRHDLESANLIHDIRALLHVLEIPPEEIDLMIDYEYINQASPLTLISLCSLLPHLYRWRTFTVASGAFPVDLSDIKKHTVALLPRNDWKWWSTQIADGPTLPRIPTFGDYTIQHPVYFEPREGWNFSASIRYTSENDWVIMRGEGVQNEGGTGFDQYPALAELLMDHTSFRSADYSDGDGYIVRMSKGTEGTGSATTWLQAGFNHHITLVIDQIASLFAGAVDRFSPIRPSVLDTRANIPSNFPSRPTPHP